MREPPSTVHGGRARPDQPVERPSASTHIPGAEEQMRKQASGLDEWFAQAPEAVAVLGTDDRIVRVNEEFTRMFGYEPDEALERSINDLIVPDGLVESSREYTRQLRQGGRIEIETVRRRKDRTRCVSLLP